MELFEIKSKNKILIILHKIILVTGILALFYLLINLIEKYLNKRKTL